jgi:hypothetical protein
MVGDDSTGVWPTLKFVSSSGQEHRILEVEGQWYTGVNQDNFYRQIRNFIVDAEACAHCTGMY